MCYDRHNNYVWRSNYRRLKKERTMRADKYFAERFGSRTKAAEELTAGRILRGRQAAFAERRSENRRRI